MKPLQQLLACILFFVSILGARDTDAVWDRLENDAQITHAAEKLAAAQELPLSIMLDGNILMRVVDRRNNEPLYRVITNFAHPRQGSYLATFQELRQRYDLSDARFSYAADKLNSRRTTLATASLLAPDTLLMVVDSGNDRVMVFDYISGDSISVDFIPTQATLATPIRAQQTARNTITVSDQLSDGVLEYTLDGMFKDYFAPQGGVNNSILDNCRGHLYLEDGTLLVCNASGPNADAIASFDTLGAYLGNFIDIGAGGLDSPWDILVRTSDILVSTSISDAVLRYDFTGAFLDTFAAPIAFARQMAEMPDGRVAVCNFSGITTSGIEIYSANGDTLLDRINPVTGNRGLWLLGNGNFLTTNGAGVHEVDPNTNTLVRTMAAGNPSQHMSLYINPAAGAAGFALSTALVSFSDVAANTSVSDTVDITNTGAADLQVSAVTSTNPGFTVVPATATIPAGNNAPFTVTFTADTLIGMESGEIIFEHNAPSSPDTLLVEADVTTGIGDPGALQPQAFALAQNYPNPFNPETQIAFTLPSRQTVRLAVYDLQGRRVATFVDGSLPAGSHRLTFRPERLASGVYIYRLTGEKETLSRKMLLIR